MKRIACLIVLGLATIATAGAGGGSPGAPTTEPTLPEAGVQLTPIGALHAYNDSMRKGETSDLRNRLSATTEDAKKFADSTADLDAAVGKLVKLASDKFGEDSAHLIGHESGDIGNADLVHAEETIDGDHAVVSIGGMSPTPMILKNGQWKLDMDASAAINLQVFGQIDAPIGHMQKRIALANDLVAAMNAGDVKTVDEAVTFIRLRGLAN